MDSLPHILVIFVVGMAAGTYLTVKYLSWATRKKRHARENALRDIASHKWDTGKVSDAVVITRMALKGLGEDR